MFLEEYCDIINEELKEFGQEEKIALWGAGENAVRLLQYTDLLKYNIVCIIDKNLYGRRFFGKIVVSPLEADLENIEGVIITAYAEQEEIRVCLEKDFSFQGQIFSIHKVLSVPFREIASRKNFKPDGKAFSIIGKNIKYKNIHTGERVFILCTGPSIANMDLIRLKNEKTIAVNSFYLHKDCLTISPDYYCEPAFEEFSSFDTLSMHLKRMHQSAKESQYFFGISEKHTVDQIEEYKESSVNYIAFLDIFYDSDENIDLTNFVMAPQSVSVMALEIAMYMGFQEIYLLGTEHDDLLTKQHKHFYKYEESIASQERTSEDESGYLKNVSFDENLAAIYNLWKQYKTIKKIAERKGIKIYNATPAGVLDIFERVDFGKICI